MSMAHTWNTPAEFPQPGQRIDARCRKDANYTGWYFGRHLFHGMPDEEPAVFSVPNPHETEAFTVFPWDYVIEWRPATSNEQAAVL